MTVTRSGAGPFRVRRVLRTKRKCERGAASFSAYLIRMMYMDDELGGKQLKLLAMLLKTLLKYFIFLI